MNTASRQRYRFRLDGRATITVFRPAGKFDFWGRISDVSEGGMGAMVSGELEPGEFVVVQFSLSTSSHALELRARVCHRRGFCPCLRIACVDEYEILACFQEL
jgi:PilZ domain-containing protein